MNKHAKIKILLNDKYKKTSKEFKLIEYLNNQPLSIINKPINIVSNELSFNASTLTRIVRKLGFKNYASFRNFVIVKLTENNSHLITSEQKNNSTNVLTNSLLSNNLAIEKTINDIDQQKFDEIINEIISAKRILLFGIGFSSAICHQLAKYFECNNVNCYNLSNFHSAFCLVNCSSEDLWIIISITLTTKETTSLLKELALKTKNKIIIITSNEKKEILKKANYVLQLKSSNDLSKDEKYLNFNYKVALTSLANLMINSVNNKINDNKLEKIAEFNEKIKKWKK